MTDSGQYDSLGALNVFKDINAAPKPVLTGSVLMVLAVFIAFLPALHGGFIWDDDAYVTANRLLTAPDGLKQIWFSAHSQSQYFPMTYTTLRLERALWGLEPLGYHTVNVFLHAMNALLAWAVLRRLAVPGAWLAAALFALHPVQVESAAWITELKNTQSTLFYLLALLAWMRFTAETTSRRWRFYALALLLHAAALFSKTTACTLPAGMVLVLWLRKQTVGWRRLAQIAPFLFLGLVMGLVSVWWESHLGNLIQDSGAHLGFVERFLVATRALWFYAGKLAWPFHLTFSYPRWTLDAHDPRQYVGAVGCLAVAGLLWYRRNTWGRGPIVAAAFFVAALSPMLGFFPLYTFYYTFVADHYQYLACLGLLALFAAGLARLAAHLRISARSQWVLSLSLLLVLGALTWRQAGVYLNAETLWRDTLGKNPNSWLAHNDLGMILAARGQPVEAEAHYREALRLNPDDADIHYNLGNLLVATGRSLQAIPQYQLAAQLRPTDADIYNNLGVVLYSSRRLDEAVAQFREAIRYRPDSARFHCNLGNALLGLHKRDEAVREYREALRLDPDCAEAKARLSEPGAQAPQSP